MVNAYLLTTVILLAIATVIFGVLFVLVLIERNQLEFINETPMSDTIFVNQTEDDKEYIATCPTGTTMRPTNATYAFWSPPNAEGTYDGVVDTYWQVDGTNPAFGQCDNPVNWTNQFIRKCQGSANCTIVIPSNGILEGDAVCTDDAQCQITEDCNYAMHLSWTCVDDENNPNPR